MLNSLSQTLVKIASPGVPDFYHGAELWDLSLVDPDNRRPVDFEKRRAMLAGIREQDDADAGRLVQDLLSTKEDGRIKLFHIHRALNARNTHREIFRKGVYLPLESGGTFDSHVIAFARRYQRRWALVVAPRFLSHLVPEGDFPLGRPVWQDTEVIMPDGAPAAWRNVITSEDLAAGQGTVGWRPVTQFSRGLAHGRGKDGVCATHNPHERNWPDVVPRGALLLL